MSNVDPAKFESQSIVDYTVKGWTKGDHRIHVALFKDTNDRISAIALNLPGVASDGDTEEEALANFAEAAGATLESYRESGTAIPWTETPTEDIPKNAKRIWVVVDG